MSVATNNISLFALRWYTKFLCVYVLFVIFAGALVTSHDAGLSVPDWPSTYGENMFLFPVYKWVGGIFYEHGHRLVAFGVGSLTIILVVWSWWIEKRSWVRKLTYAALGLVIAQGFLGGLTVLLRLPVTISSAHAVLAQTFLGIILVLAYAHSAEYQELREEPTSGDTRVRSLALDVLIIVYIQLIIGAIMRHSGAGLAVLDFPTMAGSLVPSLSDETINQINIARHSIGFGSVDSRQVLVHLLHRGCAVLVVGAVGSLLYKIFTVPTVSPKIRQLGWVIGGVVVVQFLLGMFTVLSVRNPFIASVHVLTGAVLLASALLLVLRTAELTKKSSPTELSA